MFEVEVNNGLAFPIFEPMISGDRSIVLVLFAVVSTPFVERRPEVASAVMTWASQTRLGVALQNSTIRVTCCFV
jgi:hypothetical protein